MDPIRDTAMPGNALELALMGVGEYAQVPEAPFVRFDDYEDEYEDDFEDEDDFDDFSEEEESFDDDEIAELGWALSKRTFGFVWAVACADDDALAYQLFRAGKLTDRYEAGSDFEVQGGNAQALAEAFGCPENVAALDAVLRRPGLGDGSYTFASERHSDIAVALQLPADWVCLGYTYLSEGDLPEGLAKADLLHVPIVRLSSPLPGA
ncbi:MAG TPA: hypothetical protein PLI66_04925 [Spirochaetales bacterium]|nr:hypothetical protein [Spirochaetales bacterium]